MRLFYIIFFCAISIPFAVCASQKKQADALPKNHKTTFVTCKKSKQLKSDFQPDNDSLQKDLVNNPVLKISSSAFLLLGFLVFLFFKHNVADTKAAIKRLNYNYWCLFKMLYPKHVFW
ncbi:hypothetical protein [Pedobacter soli]|uniref:Uncharacterized protein n=1 Tax=Pedobacter soli TaxID=390242 RepID=A0A1G6N6A6_9SPHI|nr:hypothetical protein [Pedobacter soli]SDC62756.1 hypothetical protein SAMN04488024_102563 [Pedobacter soli]